MRYIPDSQAEAMTSYETTCNENRFTNRVGNTPRPESDLKNRVHSLLDFREKEERQVWYEMSELINPSSSPLSIYTPKEFQ